MAHIVFHTNFCRPLLEFILYCAFQSRFLPALVRMRKLPLFWSRAHRIDLLPLQDETLNCIFFRCMSLHIVQFVVDDTYHSKLFWLSTPTHTFPHQAAPRVIQFAVPAFSASLRVCLNVPSLLQPLKGPKTCVIATTADKILGVFIYARMQYRTLTGQNLGTINSSERGSLPGALAFLKVASSHTKQGMVLTCHY